MRLAVIGTFYRRHENSLPLLKRILIESTRKPDELWLMCEAPDDIDALEQAFAALNISPDGTHLVMLRTPTHGGGYAVIPYSNKINYALDRTHADAVCYLDNGSMPDADKYAVMLDALETHPEWGAVYCAQRRTGYQPTDVEADRVVEDAFCHLNYTQVMHRRTTDRWTLDMRDADPDLADGIFWRSLHKTLGSFHPAGGTRVLDVHHIPSPAAAGINQETP